MRGVQNALRDHRPKIILAEDETNTNRAYLYPMCLQSDDVAPIVAAFTSIANRS